MNSLTMVCKTHDGQQKSFEIRQSVPIVVGRGPDCAFQVSDPNASSAHCVLTLGKEGLVIQDLGSGCGTYVNYKRVTRGSLGDGDLIRIGSTEFWLSSNSTIDPSLLTAQRSSSAAISVQDLMPQQKPSAFDFPAPGFANSPDPKASLYEVPDADPFTKAADSGPVITPVAKNPTPSLRESGRFPAPNDSGRFPKAPPVPPTPQTPNELPKNPKNELPKNPKPVKVGDTVLLFHYQVGRNPPKTFELKGLLPIFLGTAGDCDVVVDDPHVSDRHCVFVNSAYGPLVQDLESSHGTFVNFQQVSKAFLENGDKVHLGSVTLWFGAPAKTPPALPNFLEKNLTSSNRVSKCPKCREEFQPSPIQIYWRSTGQSPESWICSRCQERQQFTTLAGEGYELVKALEWDLWKTRTPGSLYLARDTRGQRVLVRDFRSLFSENAHSLLELLDDYEDLSLLRNPHILATRHLSRNPGKFYYVSDYFHGQPLSLIVQEIGLFDSGTACQIALELIQALRILEPFEERLYLTPDDVLVTTLGQVKLMNVPHRAVLRALQRELEQGPRTLGSWQLFADINPSEQVSWFQDQQYWLGALIYQSLTGCLLRDNSSKSGGYMRALLRFGPVPLQERNPHLPDHLCSWVMRCLQSQESDRFSSWEELRAAITESKAALSRPRRKGLRESS